jgi:hypothetical protein
MNEQKKTQAALLREIIFTTAVLFKDQFGELYACIACSDYSEIMKANSRQFKAWAARAYYDRYNNIVSSTALQNVLLSFEGGYAQCFPLANRVCWHDKAVYYDMVNRTWDCIKITADGWQIEKQPRPLLRRYAHMRPQCFPEKGGDLNALFNFFYFDDDTRLLLKVMLVSYLLPEIPHPVLVLYGAQGAAKSTLFKLMRQVIDPSMLLVISFPEDKRELVQKLAHNYFCGFDNVSYLNAEQSDTLCRAATGDGFSKRQLFTDDDDIIYSYYRCVGLNGINTAPTKADLLDRSIIIEMQRIPKEKRKSEAEIMNEFEQQRGRIFGAALDCLSKAMQIKPLLKLTELPRMADFATWGEAISQALGYPAGRFLEIYAANIDQLHLRAVEAEAIGDALLTLMKTCEEWKGKPSELLEELKMHAMESEIKSKWWPKAPHILTRRLNDLKTNLAELGITFESSHDGTQRNIKLLRKSVLSVNALESGQTGQNNLNATNAANALCQNYRFSCAVCGGKAGVSMPDGRKLCADCHAREKGALKDG